MPRILVCPPDYFGIEYEINPWMRLSNAANTATAQTQWQALIQILQNEIAATLEWMVPWPDLPDLVFTANAGFVHGSIAIPSHFRHPERQREEEKFEQWFRTHGYTVMPLEQESFFEGAGDLLGFPDCWFGGYRQRSDIRAYHQISQVFQKEVLPLELVNNYFYHLDTCFCPLTGGELLYYPHAFDSYAQETIASCVPLPRRLVVSSKEAKRFACNAVCVGHHIVLPTGCPKTTDMLTERGYCVHAVDLSEFMKAGGSAKCLTLTLDSHNHAR